MIAVVSLVVQEGGGVDTVNAKTSDHSDSLCTLAVCVAVFASEKVVTTFYYTNAYHRVAT
jgi:hypothetical protein